MAEPHSFREEMAFNNGGPRGDFAQSSAPTLKNAFNSPLCLLLSLSFSFYFFSSFHKKKKIKNTFREYICVPSSAGVWRGNRSFFLGGKNHDLSLQEHQKQEQQTSLNLLFFPPPLPSFFPSTEANVPGSMFTVPYAFQTDAILRVHRPKNTSKRRRTNSQTTVRLVLEVMNIV